VRHRLQALLVMATAAACLVPMTASIGAPLPVGRTDATMSPSLRQQKPKPKPLPPMKRQKTALAVIEEHFEAINECDWERVMAQYPVEVQFFLPGGQVVKGREAVGELFRNFFKPVEAGGLCGLKFEPQNSFAVGDTINVQWEASGAFLAEPYRGADAYETQDGLMWAQVTTFDAAQLKKK